MAGDEGDFGAGFVGEFDLVANGGFCPGALLSGAVLKDVSGAATDGRDVFMVIVGSFLLLDDHGDNDGWGELGEFADAFGGDFAGIFGAASVDVVGVATGVGAIVRVGFGIIVENWVIGGKTAVN